MKKLRLLLISAFVVIMTFSFVSCSSSSVVGKWQLDYMDVGGHQYTPDEWGSIASGTPGATSFGITMNIKADKTCTWIITLNDTKDEQTFFWEFEDNTLLLMRNETDSTENASLTFEYKNKKLSCNVGYVFKKK